MTIPQRAIAAAAQALYWEDGRAELGKWGPLPSSKKTLYYHQAQQALDAATPYIEAELREKIADEILERRGYAADDEKCCNICDARVDEAEFIATNLKNGKWYDDL